jgi:hypothetical protein
MKARCALVAAAAIAAWLLAAPAAGAERVPRDFTLIAEYYPALPELESDTWGRMPWHRWTLTVTADGRALQETQRSGRGSVKGLRQRFVRLRQRDVARLVTTIRTAGFERLAGDYAFAVSRAATLVLRVRMNGRSHEVTVYGPERVKGDPDVAAFLRVWNQTLRLVPPPNARQGPE